MDSLHPNKLIRNVLTFLKMLRFPFVSMEQFHRSNLNCSSQCDNANFRASLIASGSPTSLLHWWFCFLVPSKYLHGPGDFIIGWKRAITLFLDVAGTGGSSTIIRFSVGFSLKVELSLISLVISDLWEFSFNISLKEHKLYLILGNCSRFYVK